MSGQHCENYDVKQETVHCYPRNVDRCCTWSLESQYFPVLRLGKHWDSRETNFSVPLGTSHPSKLNIFAPISEIRGGFIIPFCTWKREWRVCWPFGTLLQFPFLALNYAHVCVVPVYTYDASISLRTRFWKSFHSLVLVLMLASLRRKFKPGQRKHEHKHKALMLTSHRFTRFLVLMLMLASYL